MKYETWAKNWYSPITAIDHDDSFDISPFGVCWSTLSLFNIIISYIYIFFYKKYPLDISTIPIILNYNVYPLEFGVLGAKITTIIKLFRVLIFSTADRFVRNESLCAILCSMTLVSTMKFESTSFI